MIKNYFKIAWRSLVKNRFYSLLNILGLSIGFAVSILLLFYVKGEMSFDQFHTNSENIFRIGLEAEYDDTKEKWANVPNIAGPIFKDNLSEVIEQVRFLKHDFGEKANLNIDGKNFIVDDLYWVDSTIFNVFDLDLISGDPTTALDQPNKIILSKSVSERIFGPINPVGKIIKIDNRELKITGIYEDFPSNSTLDCGVIASFSSLKWAAEKLTWDNASFETFLLTQPKTKPADLSISMNTIMDKNVPKEDQWFSFFAQPLLDIHLHSDMMTENGYSARLGNYKQIKIMLFLALAVLLLACFNYINMATARSQQRFREVGINKTLGATNIQMIRRFMIETGILVFISLFIGVFFIKIATPFASSLIGQSFNTDDLLNLEWLTTILGVGFFITFFAGLYPALFLSNFTPKKLLSPLQTGISGNRFFRKTLVVGQFVVCISLIITVIIFNQQLKYIGQKNLGYQADQVIAINTFSNRSNSSQVDALMNTYRRFPEVETISRVQGYPGIEVSGYSFHKVGNENISQLISSNHVGPGFEEVLGLNIIAGKTLPKKLPGDTTIQVILNETAIKFLGWSPEEAIGKKPPGLYRDKAEVVGIVEDFHFESFHNPISSYTFTNGTNLGGMPYILAKINTNNIGKTLKKLELDFNNLLPEAAFEYDFLSDQTARLYASETKMSKIISVFTFLTIFISCLGLFGLAAFTTERRIKEIGIRKVLGASVGGIVKLLSKDFLKPVILALLIASPIAYYLMNEWLQNYAYHVEVQWWIFLLAGSLALTIAFLTVSFQSVKAALKSPVDSIGR